MKDKLGKPNKFNLTNRDMNDIVALLGMGVGAHTLVDLGYCLFWSQANRLHYRYHKNVSIFNEKDFEATDFDRVDGKTALKILENIIPWRSDGKWKIYQCGNDLDFKIRCKDGREIWLDGCRVRFFCYFMCVKGFSDDTLETFKEIMSNIVANEECENEHDWHWLKAYYECCHDNMVIEFGPKEYPVRVELDEDYRGEYKVKFSYKRIQKAETKYWT